MVSGSVAPGEPCSAGSDTVRPVADTMPWVTLLASPSGLPIASTMSPTSSAAESPKTAGRSPAGSLTLITARSSGGSAPTRVAGRGVAELGSSAPVIILLGRPGRPVEQDDDQPELRAWDWSALPTALGPAAGPVVLRARTSDELASALDEAGHYNQDAGRPVLVEADLDTSDARLAA
jgi:hypothetical protein